MPAGRRAAINAHCFSLKDPAPGAVFFFEKKKQKKTTKKQQKKKKKKGVKKRKKKNSDPPFPAPADMETLGYTGTPINDRRYSKAELAGALHKVVAYAKR